MPEDGAGMDGSQSLRESVFTYIKQKYGGAPEYPWMRFPDYAVFRHPDSGKWYALVMDVPRKKLGLPGEGRADILNVKLGDPFLADLLVQQPGFLRGYHISRGNWISVLLDGAVPPENVYPWIDESYAVTASKKTLQALRAPKEWIVPANPKYYDVIGAFNAADEIEWKQGSGIKPGDTVFLYVAAPVSALLYRCAVTETEIPFDFTQGALTIKKLMKIRLEKRYPPSAFPFERLRDEFGIFAVRGPRGVPHSLSEALKE